MAWNELLNKRNRRSRTYQDADKRCWSGTFTPLHYESELGSGIFNTELNLSPIRIDTPSFDGWHIIENSWHYALGKDLVNHGNQDGWIGFSGRQGAHWFKFRLTRVGYLHWPTRSWDDIGSTPNYDRVNLFQETRSLTMGPNDDTVNVESIATWSNIWTTPGGGDLSIRWTSGGDRLKEEVIVNQTGREWIEANRPPTTPLVETYFGFVFQLDWSDIPHIYRQNILKSADDDFADDGQPIVLRDALDRLLAFMPISYVDAGKRTQRTDPPLERQPIRKRYWKGGDGNYYLLVGVRTDILNSMQVGPLVFDPTVNEQVGASSDDGVQDVSGINGDITSASLPLGNHNGNPVIDGTRFTSVNVPNAATITSATWTVTASDTYNAGGATITCFVHFEDEDDTVTFTAANNNISGRTLTTAKTAFTPTSVVKDTEYNVDVTTGAQEVVNRGGWSANNDMSVLAKDNGSDSSEWQEFYAWDGDTSKAAKLEIVYASASNIPRPPAAYNTLAIY